MRKKTFAIIAALLMIMVSAVTAHADGTALESALKTFNDRYGAVECTIVELQGAYLLTAKDSEGLSDDARRLFTNSDTNDDSYEALVYIIARQYVYDFPVPHIMAAGYIVKSDGTCAVQNVEYIFPTDADWQTGEYAGVVIEDVTQTALEYMDLLKQSE